MRTPRYWLSRLETDRTLRRVVCFWGVFYGAGYVVTTVAFVVSMGVSPIWQTLVFHALLLVMAACAALVMVSVTLAVMRMFGRTTPSNEDAP